MHSYLLSTYKIAIEDRDLIKVYATLDTSTID
jgi:hypothetical protein